MRIVRRERIEVVVEGAVLRGSAWLTLDQLAAAAGISVSSAARLVRAGLVEPAAPGTAEFPAVAVARLRRILRLRRDLDLGLLDAATLADLIGQIERLESELRRTRSG